VLWELAVGEGIFSSCEHGSCFELAIGEGIFFLLWARARTFHVLWKLAVGEEIFFPWWKICSNRESNSRPRGVRHTPLTTRAEKVGHLSS
jgi:hypothetical protein